jgi:Aspartyl protease
LSPAHDPDRALDPGKTRGPQDYDQDQEQEQEKTKTTPGDVGLTMRRLLKPMLALATIFAWAIWQAPQLRSADTSPKLPIEVPMQIGEGMPTVEVMINGRGPFVFGFDTGAQGGVRIDASLVEKFNLKPTGDVQATDPSRRNFQTSQTYQLDSLSVGNLRLNDVTVISREFKNSPRPLQVDGILGLNAFADYLVTLDFPGKKLRFEKGELPKADGAEVLDYKNEAGIATLDLTVGDKKIKAHLDTGNGIGAFVFPTAFAEKLNFVGEPRVVGRARSATGDTEIKQVQIKDMIKLGRHEFPDATIVYPALGDIANVGFKTLSQFAITFDQPHERIRLVRP